MPEKKDTSFVSAESSRSTERTERVLKIHELFIEKYQTFLRKHEEQLFVRLSHFFTQLQKFTQCSDNEASDKKHKECVELARTIMLHVIQRDIVDKLRKMNSAKTNEDKNILREQYSAYVGIADILQEVLTFLGNPVELVPQYGATILCAVESTTEVLEFLKKINPKLARMFSHFTEVLLKLCKQTDHNSRIENSVTVHDLSVVLIQLIRQVAAMQKQQETIFNSEKINDNPQGVTLSYSEVVSSGTPFFIFNTCTKYGEKMSPEYLVSELHYKTYQVLYKRLLALLNTLLGSKDTDQHVDAVYPELFESILRIFRGALPKRDTSSFLKDFSRAAGREFARSDLGDNLTQAVEHMPIDNDDAPLPSNPIRLFHFSNEQDRIEFVELAIDLGWLEENHKARFVRAFKIGGSHYDQYTQYATRAVLDWCQLPTHLGKRRTEILQEVFRALYAFRDIVEGFEMAKFIAMGGMGEVWRGICTEEGAKTHSIPEGTSVAVKVLRDSRQFHIDMFLNESAISALVPPHPNVIGHITSGRIGHHPFMVQEFVRGCKSVKDLMTKRVVDTDGTIKEIIQALPLETIINIIAGAASGLAHMHNLAKPVYHRDIKPDNIMVSKDGVAKIIDFGLAGHYNPDAEKHLSGTAPFLAPETFERGRDKLDNASDVYQLGVTLFCMLSGGKVPKKMPPRPQLAQDASKDTEQQAIDAYYQSLCDAHSIQSPRFDFIYQIQSEKNPVVHQLIALITNMMSVDPDDRPTMVAVLMRMKSICPELLSSVTIPEGFDATDQESARAFASGTFVIPQNIIVPPDDSGTKIILTPSTDSPAISTPSVPKDIVYDPLAANVVNVFEFAKKPFEKEEDNEADVFDEPTMVDDRRPLAQFNVNGYVYIADTVRDNVQNVLDSYQGSAQVDHSRVDSDDDIDVLALRAEIASIPDGLPTNPGDSSDDWDLSAPTAAPSDIDIREILGYEPERIAEADSVEETDDLDCEDTEMDFTPAGGLPTVSPEVLKRLDDEASDDDTE